MPRTFFRLLLVSFVSGTLALAQAPDPDFTLRIDVPLVSVDVTIEDTNGNLVKDLPREAFELFEDGVRQDIRNFSPVSTPNNIFLLFDRSGSTQHKWRFMEKAVASFIMGLRPQDRLAMATFDYKVEAQLEWTGDRTKAIRALSQLANPKALGETNLYDSVERTLRREFKKVTGRRALVVLTDGRDTALYRGLAKTNRLFESSEDRLFQKVFRAARDERIPVYFIAINTDRNLDTNAQRDEYHNLHIIFPNTDVPQRYLRQVRLRMEQLAEVSGGRILFPSRIDEMVPLYQQIGRELGMSYSLGYVSSNPANAAFRRIEVRTRDGNFRITQSRAGYYGW
jgi:Ca-activated chloride channel family protein